MIQISLGTLVAIAGFVITVGPGLLYVGRMSKQVERNTSDLREVRKQLSDIHHYVKNGSK